PCGIGYMPGHDCRTRGDQVRERIDRQHQPETPAGEIAEIGTGTAGEIDVIEPAAAPPRLVNHRRRNIATRNTTNMRRQRPLDPADAAPDVEHFDIAAEKTPFPEPRDDLVGGTLEDFGRAERIE